MGGPSRRKLGPRHSVAACLLERGWERAHRLTPSEPGERLSRLEESSA